MAKDNAQSSFQRGVMSLLILSLLDQEDMYGYQIVQEIAARSGGTIVTQEGSLYPVLYKLQDQGMISGEKVLVGKRMTRVYYHLEEAGGRRGNLVQAITISPTAFPQSGQVLRDCHGLQKQKEEVQALVGYIDGMEEDLSLSGVSEQLHVSPNYLSANMKKYAGDTFMNLLIKKRMEVAHALLTTSSLKIYEVARQCGYSDQHYFSFCFKKYYGVSPAQLRRAESERGGDGA